MMSIAEIRADVAQTPFVAGRQIAKSLMPAEDAADRSILASAELITKIVGGRLGAKLALETGHDAVMSAGAMMHHHLLARDHAVACHRALARARDDLGLDADDMGCSINKPLADRARRPRAKVA